MINTFSVSQYYLIARPSGRPDELQYLTSHNPKDGLNFWTYDLESAQKISFSAKAKIELFRVQVSAKDAFVVPVKTTIEVQLDSAFSKPV